MRLFNKVAILIHEPNINNINTLYYWSLTHYCWYWLAYIIMKYYQFIGIECQMRTDSSINYWINKRI